MANGLEKREFQRLNVPIKVVTEIVTGADESTDLPPLQVQSRNISKAGICIETTTIEIAGVNMLSGSPSARENRLRLKIDLIPDEPPVTAIGEARWYDIVREANECTYQVGIEFLDVKDLGRDQLARFLKRHRTGGFFRKLFG